MSNSIPTGASRQRYLALVGRLYELAAGYTSAELRSMISTWAVKDQKGVQAALQALIELHDEVASPGARPEIRAAAQPAVIRRDDLWITPARNAEVLLGLTPKKGQGKYPSVNLQPKTLQECLMDPLLFPRTSDIASVLPQHLSMRPKEGRERYVKRVVKEYQEMSPAAIGSISERVLRRVAKGKNDGSFLSDWEKLIKEL